MKLEIFTLAHLDKAREIHRKFFKDKFNFPEFEKFIQTFVYSKDDGTPIIISGLRPILEVVTMTNKDCTPREKYAAYYNLLWATERYARDLGFDEIHCFPEYDAVWRARLKKDGFKETKYPSFVKNL